MHIAEVTPELQRAVNKAVESLGYPDIVSRDFVEYRMFELGLMNPINPTAPRPKGTFFGYKALTGRKYDRALTSGTTMRMRITIAIQRLNSPTGGRYVPRDKGRGRANRVFEWKEAS